MSKYGILFVFYGYFMGEVPILMSRFSSNFIDKEKRAI